MGRFGSVFMPQGPRSLRGEACKRGSRWRWGVGCVTASLVACQPPAPQGPPPPKEDVRAPTAPIHYVTKGASGISDSESAIEDRLRTARARMNALAVELIAFWKKNGPDPVHGGFHGFNDRQGRPKEDAAKGLVQQTRHLWTFSNWYERREAKPEIKAVADNVYKFLVDHFLDKDGEYFYSVSRDGKRAVDPKKQLYPQSFAIFALSTYGRVFDNKEARERALTCFRSIDKRTHDEESGGYDQSNDPGWLAPGAQKDTNTHIHLLEAFTALYRATKDATVRQRLEEMVGVVATKLVQPSGYAHKEFYRDFRPHAQPVVSYGHDLETAWLLMDALEALGKADEKIGQIALTLGKNSAESGFDAAEGGYYEEGVPGGAPVKLEKVWWVQAEALPGLWWLYRLSGDEVFIDRLEKTLTWIEKKQRDLEYGEWYWGIMPGGGVGSRGDHKGEEWKASYHGTRALVFTSDWIAATLGDPAEPPKEK
jgi:cellobiose epimerase